MWEGSQSQPATQPHTGVEAKTKHRIFRRLHRCPSGQSVANAQNVIVNTNVANGQVSQATGLHLPSAAAQPIPGLSLQMRTI
jgi:hypothetical protein